jgi:protein SCO1/2
MPQAKRAASRRRAESRAGHCVRAALVLLLALACGPELYDADGTVTEVRPDLRQVVIDHEDIPGLMPAMTMNFDVADPSLLEGLAAGDRIHFRIARDGESYRIVRAEKLGEAGAAGSSGSAGAAGASGSAGLSAVAGDAEPAPPFELTDQDGAPRSLASLRGKVVLLDFVYANCPGPCPILTGTHVRVQKLLPEAAREKVWLVSITLDPARDTPAALRTYGTARGADFSHWSFLTGPTATVEQVIASYGVGKLPGERGEIQHIVVTFLIDAEGRIAKRYFGLEHHADDLVKDVTAAAGL